MAENDNNTARADLLATILEVIHGQRGQNISELVSLLALSNLLGIISFLNSQDLKFEVKSSGSKPGVSELKEMAASLLGSMGGGSSDKKLNPAVLLNLMKALSAGEGSGSETKNGGKTEDKTKNS
ncbi:hypothetical protein [Thermoanaerobacterium sp. DL9XJH110]|jgi:uncharacterized protein YjgD (DUF1641 family)|uniref:hypothetical protein n=1 Tax=Thermoanaerobacterium sp. DL9XJH110 TaxID=3386643 RepID=UPI003BB4BCD1